MIYKYCKYRNFDDFVDNKPKNYDVKFTILNICKGKDPDNTLNSNCFYCLFCLNNKNLKEQLNNGIFLDYLTQLSNESFNLKPVVFKKSSNLITQSYRSFEDFTSTNETRNIQPWVSSILINLNGQNNRLSMEIPIENLSYDRPGRLDVGIINNNNYMLAIETKVSLDDALADERFVEQHTKYTEIISNKVEDYSYFTVIGGKETDLYPEDSEYCTGLIGNKAKRFYRLINDNNIKFISANALLCIYFKFLSGKNVDGWDSIFKNIFNNDNVIGLLSAGKVIKVSEDKYKISKL